MEIGIRELVELNRLLEDIVIYAGIEGESTDTTVGLVLSIGYAVSERSLTLSHDERNLLINYIVGTLDSVDYSVVDHSLLESTLSALGG